MTPITPAQAREIASNLFFPNGQHAYSLRSLADQVEALTKERDALKAELARPESTVVSLMRAENAALKDAARLALDALDASQGYCSGTHTEDAVKKAMAALKAVL